MALAAAGCGGHGALQHAGTNPEVKQGLTQGEAIVKGCLSKGSRKAIVACIAPPGHGPALEKCALTAATHDFYSHAKLAKDLATCVERYR